MINLQVKINHTYFSGISADKLSSKGLILADECGTSIECSVRSMRGIPHTEYFGYHSRKSGRRYVPPWFRLLFLQLASETYNIHVCDLSVNVIIKISGEAAVQCLVLQDISDLNDQCIWTIRFLKL